jgi:hypothetical protein
MWNRQIIYKFYKTTVMPVTCCTVSLSVYSRGYSDRMESVINQHKTSTFIYVCNMIESSLWGYCVGVMYPIGIPATIVYLYVNDT